MLIFFKKKEDDQHFFMLLLCDDQLGHGEYLSTKNKWMFIVVYKQNIRFRFKDDLRSKIQII